MILTDLLPGQRFEIEGQGYEVDYLPAGIYQIGSTAGKPVYMEGAPRIAMLYVIGADGERIPDGRSVDGSELLYKRGLISDTRFNPIFETEEDRARQRDENDLL